ncbi:MFS transporter [Falsiroseomonas oryzae]|uniref:MFS transporter n=1 Tax=Falsiroseomonas oryzae TaxID=2766473 RepID=UPI0022EB5183|nr:MFS transporter [Roseomonas sp. MO-31]
MPPQALPWALIGSACLAMFAISASGTTRAPFLLEMARDLSTSLALTANLMAINAVTWGVASLLVGPVSDRIGRRPFLLGAPLLLGLSSVGIAGAQTFPGVAAWVAVAGAAAGAISTAVVTEVSSRVEDRQRGRALGWALSGQSLALLLGVPLAAWVGAAIGWRGVNLCVAAVALAAGLTLLLATRRPVAARGRGQPSTTDYRAAMSPRVLRLLATGVTERSCYALAVTFFATFLQSAYGLSLAGLALPLAVFALGNILGTLLGGQLADRLPNRLLTYAGAMLAAAGIALPLFLWHGSLVASVVLGFGFVLAISVARPCLMAALSNVPEEVRGTVLGLNVTSASMGWLGATALGGLAMAEFGFAGLAPMAAVLSAAGAWLALSAARRG